ncbi:MAG: hypothetical protein M1510_04750 [Nitrospirae bacterium]|nr:hypothetical protein [Nitrospirota bacterium]
MRVLPRIIRPNATSTDTYYHFGAAEEIRRNSFRIPKKLRQYLMNSPYDYPPLFHYVLSVFKRSTRERIERSISAFIDSLHIIAVYMFTYYFFMNIYPVDHYRQYSLWTTFLYLSSPALLSISTGPRAYQATPRVLGELLAGITFMAGFLYHFEKDIVWGVLSVLSAAATLLTSKFSGQVILFFSIILSVFLKSAFFFLLPIFSLVTAVALTGGYYMKVLKGHVGHLYIFKKVTMRKYLNIRNKNRLIDIISLPRDLFYNYKRAFNTLFFNNTFLIVAIRNPQLALLVPIYIVLIPHFLVDEPRYFFVAWILASLICFFITSLKPFQFLGEGDRYLEYSVLPQMVLFTTFVMPSPNKSVLIWVLLGYHFILYALNVLIFSKIYRKNSKLQQNKEEVFNFLKGNAGKIRLLPIGMIYELAYKTGCGILFPSGNFAINYISEKEYDALYEVYSIPNRNIRGLLNKYGLNAIFVGKNSLADIGQKYGITYDFSDFNIVFENDFYTVYMPNGEEMFSSVKVGDTNVK